MTERKECCFECRYWRERDCGGLCRRYPEHVERYGIDWCGEYRPAGVPPASTEPVSVLTLSVRASKCVERLGVRTLGELAELSNSDILACRNTGETTLAEIRARLAERGLG